MQTKATILGLLGKHDRMTGTALAQEIGISRQAVSRHLKALVAAGRVVKEGQTRGTRYRLPRPGEKAPDAGISTSRTYVLKGLEEDRAFQDLSLGLTLEHRVSESAFSICRYAFTEMLNNAIDHSQSGQCRVAVEVGAHDVKAAIRDYGIGIFRSIQDRFGLADESAAVGELLKGKATTMAEKHSGEGIFFTSKVVDRLHFRSHRVALLFDNRKQDVIVEHRRFQRGTDVRFSISRRSKRQMARIFSEFAPEEFDFKFGKTRVSVCVALEDCVSRSQAKRLLLRLEDFREVTLDFKGVESLGQAFCDEVFRVFLQAHPETRLHVVNLRPTLVPVVRHGVDKETSPRLTIV